MINKFNISKKVKKIKQKPWRRVLIVLVLVCFGMFLSSSIWINKSIIVSFHAKTSKDLTFQIFYTTQSKTNFSEKESQKQFLKAGNNNVIFELPINNIIRFRIDPGSNPGEVKLSNITVSGNKSVRLDGEDLWIFNNHIENYSYYDGVLSLVSNQRDPHLTYKKELALLAGTYVDWCLFLICLAFAIFIFSVLVFYLAKFKIFELRSRIEIVFLTLFFSLLFVPMSHISNAEKSEQENRMLAKFPSLYVNGLINKSYGTDFEKWFNDRFLGRNLMLNIKIWLDGFVNKHLSGGGVYTGNDDWIFGASDFNKRIISDANMKKIINNISQFKKFCQNNKMKCYVELVPRRGEFALDKGNRAYEKDDVDPAFLVSEKVKKQIGFDIVYPLPEMLEANKQDLVYFKTDHHWTEWGAYIGYQALMKQIQKDFPDVVSIEEKDFDIFYDTRVRAEFDRKFWQGSLCNNLHLSESDCPLETKYRYYKHKKEKKLSVVQNDKKDKFIKYPEGSPLKAIVIGNSFTENLSSFMAYTFSNYIKLRCNNVEGDNLSLSRWENLILKEKPDILIIVIHTNHIRILPTMF